MGIIAWIVFGLIAGFLAQFLMPGKAPGGLVATIVLGIVGAIVGGFLGTILGFGDISGFDLRSMLLAVAGGLVVFFVYGFVTRRRVPWTPRSSLHLRFMSRTRLLTHPGWPKRAVLGEGPRSRRLWSFCCPIAARRSGGAISCFGVLRRYER